MRLHCESKKLCHFYFYCNFGKCWSIFKILSMSENQKEMAHNKNKCSISPKCRLLQKFYHHFFYFCCFRCVTVPLTGVINYVFFCIYICCFIANFCHMTRWGSKQSHSHRAYIVIFSFSFNSFFYSPLIQQLAIYFNCNFKAYISRLTIING